MAIPAPTRFTDLRKHLHAAQVDAAYLSHVLEQYLELPDNMPQQDWFLDPLADHQGMRRSINRKGKSKNYPGAEEL